MFNNLSHATLILLAVLAVGSIAGEPWRRHTIDDTSRGADGVRLADFNGDGHQDIATGWEEGGLVRVYQNPGPAKAKQPWPQVTVGKVASPEDAVLIDLDGDGAMDVVSSCEGRTRKIFIHWAPREKAKYLDPTAWRTEPLPASDGQLWMFCLPMQVDGRGGIDLVVGSKGSGACVGWFQSPDNPRDVAAWKFHRIVDAGWIMSLQAVDLDEDKRLEVVYSDRKGAGRGVWWLKNKAPQQVDAKDKWQHSYIGGKDREVMFLTAAGWSKEHHPYVVCAVRGGPITRFIGFSSKDTAIASWKQKEIPMPAGCGTGKGVAVGQIIVGDEANRGTVFSCENATDGRSGIRWLEMNPRGKKGPIYRDHEISGPEGVKFDRLELIDLDADGDLDVLTCEERDGLGVIWYENPAK